MLDQATLARLLLPVGELTKADVRAKAAELGLRTAAKPDSQDVCFISRTGGREAFLGERIALRPGRLVDTAGAEVGNVEAVQLVTVGQRRGLGSAPATKAERRFVLNVDTASATVTVGSLDELMVSEIPVGAVTWVGDPVAPGTPVWVQASAHGQPLRATWEADRVVLDAPVRRVAPGQSVVLYDGDAVLGGGTAG
jgi:tRNA-specific 2-thiouridylase